MLSMIKDYMTGVHHNASSRSLFHLSQHVRSRLVREAGEEDDDDDDSSVPRVSQSESPLQTSSSKIKLKSSPRISNSEWFHSKYVLSV